jgi:RNA polymerase sigma-70 factor (ECF subfamily)
MTNSSALDQLLARLCSGDPAAAEHAFLAFEPYLRQVVRRLLPGRLRPKFDSADIVQSVWSDLLKGFRGGGWHFVDAQHLRAFLVQATRNRFFDRYRREDRAARREEPLTAPVLDSLTAAKGPTPSANLRVDELRRRLWAACPPEHQAVLHLRLEGFEADEIAAQTGMHPGSVRRILRGLACRLASERTLPPR